jgi:DNA-binding HxlR family transcriptional regulator
MKLQKVTGPAKTAAKRWYDDACGTALALEFIGERWSLLIMRELIFGPRRFGEIKAHLPGISANVLTQRLEGLEANGILTRYRLPSPANVQVYDLTDWGRESEPMMRDLGRWAARSPRHDPMLFMSPASAMISLRTLIDRGRAAGERMTIAFHMPDDSFVARLADGDLVVVRGTTEDADVTFSGDTLAMRHTIYGKMPLSRDGGGGGLAVAGDLTVAQRFVDLFALPEKIAL